MPYLYELWSCKTLSGGLLDFFHPGKGTGAGVEEQLGREQANPPADPGQIWFLNVKLWTLCGTRKPCIRNRVELFQIFPKQKES